MGLNMVRVYWINENKRVGLNLSGSGASRSVLITKYSGDNITKNKADEASVMDAQQETMYVILVGNCERKRQLGRPTHRQKDILRMDL